jgi:hypothetical protein
MAPFSLMRMGRAMKQTDIGMLRTEALRVSRNHIKAELRSKGLKLSSFSQADINSFARQWFELYRAELIGNVLGQLCRANLVSAARKSEAGKSMASAVQISRTLEGVK